jgi:hypothetical protein
MRNLVDVFAWGDRHRVGNRPMISRERAQDVRGARRRGLMRKISSRLVFVAPRASCGAEKRRVIGKA